LRRASLIIAFVLWTTTLVGGCGGGDGPLTVSPAEHDYGRVMQGETRKQTFTLTNDGDRTVSFTVQPNCGCFAVSRNLRPLDPGQTLEFEVVFNTANRQGPIRGKWVTIHTDHPEVPQIVLPITGEIYRAFDVRPVLLYLGEIDGRDENYEPRIVVVRPENDYEVRFLGFFATPQAIEATAEPRDDGTLAIALRLRKDVTRPKGPFIAQVRLDLEIRDPDGTRKRHQAIVHVRGTWTL
jgi:hypothetical protein